jgi:hypothetical protein
MDFPNGKRNPLNYVLDLEKQPDNALLHLLRG